MFQSSLFKEIFLQSRIPQLVSTLDFSEMRFNQAFSEFIGYSLEELKYLSIIDFSHPDDFINDDVLYLELANGLRKEYQIQKRYIHKSGKMITGILNVSKILDEASGREFCLAQVIDITETKEIEENLIKSEKKYRLLADYSSDIIMLHRMDGVYLYASPSVQTVIGYGEKEMLGKTARDFIHPDDLEKVSKLWRDLEEGINQNYRVTYRCRKKDGSYVWLESTIKAVYDEKGHFQEMISVSRDVQERMETTELLKRSEKLALVGQMAAAVAHEIRNPLTPIKGFIQMLQQEKELNPAFVTVILDELSRVDSIISEFLSMAKPHPEKISIIQLDHLLRQVIQLLQTEALMKNKEIIFRLDDDLPAVEGDQNSLKQVFMNIIQNALEAIEEMGTVEITSFVEEENAAVLIRDNGCGIPEERMNKLGEPFYSTKEKGTGLGLMTSFHIIQNHGGSIMVKSKEGEGTAVKIMLPLKPN